MKKLLIMTFVLAGVLSAIDITGCTNITSAGTYYLKNDITNPVLSSSLNPSNPTALVCINIAANDAILDCQGHMIAGADISNTNGVYISKGKNVVIKNCIILDWNVGINVFNSPIGNLYTNIYNNTISSNSNMGISLAASASNNIYNNTVNSNSRGIFLIVSASNNITNNSFSDNSRGIYIDSGNGNNIINNKITASTDYGIYFYMTLYNTIYNNYFNNTNNVYVTYTLQNYWNTDKVLRTNIMGGWFTGGNYWANPSGSGYSETCGTSDICNPYQIKTNNIDYLPLSRTISAQPPVQDADRDGIMDDVDKCPNTPDAEVTLIIIDPASKWYGCGPSERDIDEDGIVDALDNCPSVYNHDQLDSDSQNGGDVCDVCPMDATDTSCVQSSSNGETITSEGGIITTPDGSSSIEIPAGTFSGPTSTSLTGFPNSEMHSFQTQDYSTTAYSNSYDYGPAGMAFSPPVTITISYSGYYGLGIDMAIYWYNPGTGYWEAIASSCTDPDANGAGTCTAQVDHFSKYVVGEVDRTPPITTLVASGTAESAPFGDWYVNNASAVLTATDDLSGVSGTFYCIDQTNTCTPSIQGTTLTVSSNGINYVRFYSSDLANNNEAVNSVVIKIDKDSDGDGMYSNFDQCPTIAGAAKYNGCPYGVLITAVNHTVDQRKSSSNPASSKSALVGQTMRLYKKSDLAAAGYASVTWKDYYNIINSNVPFVGFAYTYTGSPQPIPYTKCVTGEAGCYIIGVPSPADYYVISEEVTGCQADVHIGSSISATDSDWSTKGYVQKNLQLLTNIKKDGTSKCDAATSTVVTGSNLEIIQPEYVIWDGSQEAYPFVLSGDGDWTVDITPYVPAGYVVSPFNVIEVVSSETKAVAFTVSEVGSKPSDTTVVMTLTHKGKKKSLSLKVGGKDSNAWAAKKNAKRPLLSALLDLSDGQKEVVLFVMLVAFLVGGYYLGKTGKKK